MKMVRSLIMFHFMRNLRELLRIEETARAISSGLANSVLMGDGSVSIPASSVSKEINTLTVYSSGPNITMIRTTTKPPQSQETSSNTTTETISTEMKEDGSSKENA
jgi:hypothetical protein